MTATLEPPALGAGNRVSGAEARTLPVGSIVRAISSRRGTREHTKTSASEALLAWTPRLSSTGMYEIRSVGEMPVEVTPEQAEAATVAAPIAVMRPAWEAAGIGVGSYITPNDRIGYDLLPPGTVLKEVAEVGGIPDVDARDHVKATGGTELNAIDQWEPTVDYCCLTYVVALIPEPAAVPDGEAPPTPRAPRGPDIEPGDGITASQMLRCLVGTVVSNGSQQWVCVEQRDSGDRSMWSARNAATGELVAGRARYMVRDFSDFENMMVVLVPGLEVAPQDELSLLMRRAKRRLLASGRIHGYDGQARAACVLLGLANLGERDSVPLPVIGQGVRVSWYVFQWLPNVVGVGTDGWLWLSNPDAEGNVGRAVRRMWHATEVVTTINDSPWQQPGCDMLVFDLNGWTAPTYSTPKDFLDAVHDLVEKMRTCYSWCGAPIQELDSAGLGRIPDPPPTVGEVIENAASNTRKWTRVLTLPMGSIIRDTAGDLFARMAGSSGFVRLSDGRPRTPTGSVTIVSVMEAGR